MGSALHSTVVAHPQLTVHGTLQKMDKKERECSGWWKEAAAKTTNYSKEARPGQVTQCVPE